MKFQVACLIALVAVVCSVSGVERPKRGIIGDDPTSDDYTASYVARYVAAPSPVVARASRIVGAPGFAARYVVAPVAGYSAYTAPVVAPYSVLY